MERKMKRFLSVMILLVLTATLLTGCITGQKAIQNINIEGLKTTYEIGETPDYSGVSATVIYNDGTTKAVGYSELTFGELDTSVAGKKNLDITYDGFTVSIQITIKAKSIDINNKEVTEIEYFSGLPTTVYVGDELHFEQLRIVVKYNDGTEETKDVASNSNIKHNGDTIDTSAAGTQILTITFMGKSVDVEILIKEIILTGIEIDGTTVDTTITEGTEFDPTGMVVRAVYNNGAKLPINPEELTITQEGNKVTVSYQGKTAELTLSTTPPVAVSMTVTTTGFEEKKIIAGDSISTAGVIATATLNNGTTKSIANSELKFELPEINGAGVYTVTAIYLADESITASFEVTVLGISKIVINADSVSTRHSAGKEYSTSGLSVIITLSDGSKVSRSVSDGVTVDVSNLDTTVSNNSSYITASYGGTTSEQLAITVIDPDINYFIVDVDMPASLSGLDSKKDLFLNKNYGYVVGDDNHFIFKLDLTIINDSDEIVKDEELQYTSYFEIYLDGVLLEGDELAKYVDAIDGASNSIDFSSEAVGKSFLIKTRPLHGVEGREADMTRSHTVTVVDGLNIYEAWELNYLTNYDEFDFAGETGINKTHTQIAAEFLKSKKTDAVIPTGLAGIVLHSDLNITPNDLPAEYFVGSNRSNELWDILTLFPHTNDSADKTFSLHGNYYTIFSYNLPNVCAYGTGNQTDNVSNGQIFRFSALTNGNKDYDYKEYSLNISNLYMRDNNPNSNNEMTADRDMRGLIAMKVIYQDVKLDNVRLEAFYISFFIDGDHTVATLNECKIYNSWQNHIYIWSTNTIQGASDEAPSDNYTPATLYINNSSVTKCGGPVIIAQTDHSGYTSASKSGAQVHIDDNTEIWTWVTGQEAWFSAMGATSIAGLMGNLGLGLAQAGLPTIVRTTGETGETDPNGAHFMNMVMVNIVAGLDADSVLFATTDLDGKLTVGDNTYLNMNDDYAAYGYGYGDANVLQKFLEYQGAATIVNTTSGGTLVVQDNGTMDPVQPVGIADGDYVAIYKGNFGIVFGYGPYQ